MPDIRRGDIYHVVSGTGGSATGSEMRADRPAVIVSNDLNNRFAQTVEVVYLTTRRRKPLPVHVPVISTPKPSIALCEQITTVDKSRLEGRYGRVSDEELSAITDACMLSLSADPIRSGGILDE